MKRLAVVDLGTNTFHLLITNTDEQAIVPGNVCKETIAVKLGQGGINQGIIQADAYQRGIKALTKFSELINFHQATEVKAMATAAIRSASNGEQFISEARDKTGIEIDVIDGEKEAELIYKGVREAARIGDEPSLIMDIGGGSVEFIICNASGILWKRSYPVGAARMMDRFHHSDPISVQNLREFTSHLDKTLPELRDKSMLYSPRILIGSAGAFETFEELESRRFHPGKPIASGPAREINLQHFEEIATILRNSTHSQRADMPGLISLRVDMIVVATILTEYIIRNLKIESMLLSDYSLKEGILFDLLSSPA
ncbi:exopolyphosphatase [Flavihumibacter sp. R14]|nr:exopolyphosphatase [Flavihumibacter soli]